MDYRRKHTRTLLRILARRIGDEVLRNDQEGLEEGVWLLYRLAESNQTEAAKFRPEIIAALESADYLESEAQYLEEAFKAVAEKDSHISTGGKLN